MRKLSLGWLVGTAVLVPLLLLGCASAPDPQWTDGPAPTETAPVFASNDEALAAATKAYGDYIAMSDLISNEGGVDAERIAGLVSSRYAQAVLDSMRSFQKSGHVATGSSSFDSAALVRYHDDSANVASVALYGCVDVTDVTVRDLAGVVTTSADRQNRVPLQIALVSNPDSPTKLLIDKEELWTGRDFC